MPPFIDFLLDDENRQVDVYKLLMKKSHVMSLAKKKLIIFAGQFNYK